ncbi:hypothetical protein ZWY2020_041289 [Hordeum vulgare]|nr:hypothetical protein ZWY2020_041289 [Hordeum vulgare]
MSTIAAVAAIVGVVMEKSLCSSTVTGSVDSALMVAHFEFLITSEYKIPPNVFPRLALWSTTMLRAFIALDTIPRMKCSQEAIDSISEKFSKFLLIDDSIKFDSLISFGSTSTSGLNVVETFSKDLPFKINYVEPQIGIASPLNDPGFLKLMEDFEAECRRNELHVENKKKYEHFCPAKFVQQSSYIQFQQVIFSSLVQVKFYKTMTAALTVLDSSQWIFQVNEVWVDQKTLTISLSPECWMNPHSLDCYSKMLNTDKIIRGRQGLIPNTDVITHIIQREDMQWIVITANLESRRFFDIMNHDASGKDKFTSIISIVCYNFKSLFALSYLNYTSFAIKDFDYRFIAVPRTHFRYDTCVFMLQTLKTYRGMGVDLQALREIFLYEIATYNNSEVQLPMVTTFLQNHVFVHSSNKALQASTFYCYKGVSHK